MRSLSQPCHSRRSQARRCCSAAAGVALHGRGRATTSGERRSKSYPSGKTQAICSRLLRTKMPGKGLRPARVSISLTRDRACSRTSPAEWGTAMRTSFPPNYQRQTTPIERVSFQLNCRHELIPILVALQHIYGQPEVCQRVLGLIQQDVNKDTRATRGRAGLSYWEILVLAAVRMGCNCDYDALQDLAENHRTLRQILGVADDPLDAERPRSLWQRIRDNVCLLRPETIETINHVLVGCGHQLEPAAAEQVRGDTFVVDADIHYPTEANLLGDGLRKILDVAGDVQGLLPVEGWRQQDSWRKRLKKALRHVNRACRSKGPKRERAVQRAYRALYELAEQLLAKGRQLRHELPTPPPAAPALQALQEQLH